MVEDATEYVKSSIKTFQLGVLMLVLSVCPGLGAAWENAGDKNWERSNASVRSIPPTW
jgi:hypothetical protein